MEWTRHDIAPFGLSCEVFAGPPLALDVDARAPGRLALAQDGGGCSLWVRWGPGETLDAWLERIVGDTLAPARVVEPRAAAVLCALAAERVAVDAALPPAAAGVFPEGERTTETGTVRIALVGARHRGAPLLAGFRRPADDAGGARAEARFFASFRCAP